MFDKFSRRNAINSSVEFGNDFSSENSRCQKEKIDFFFPISNPCRLSEMTFVSLILITISISFY